ncbi:hypothetical protein GCM10027169_27550 [Gordonia jinhuaensis]|uniref:Uncharacterized protein n=1 Tax=Gordonia jinhuaensis TaxID=1517702 RepID=A0A916WX49_9ACTN|nr:hypothetical protein [Gordonia jinhuaensis]GGB37443.1 hypothetical protein GCM10011489_26580 [Gordonia jinhuaensis]
MPEKERVGIPRARDAKNNLFEREAVDESPQPFVKPLLCGGCTAPVVAVPGSTRRSGAGSVSVIPYYRLKSRDEHDHDEGCRYHFDERVGDIATEYRQEIERDADTYLLILRDPQSLAGPEDDEGEDNDGREVRTDVETAGGAALHPTIQAARAIARLLRHFRNDPAAQARFKASYQGVRIAWEDFFFDAEHDAPSLAARLLDTSQYPIAVLGRATLVQPFKNGDGRSVHLQTPPGAKGPDGRWVNAVLRASQPRFLGYEADDVILGYGNWQLYPESGGARVDARLWCDVGSATIKFE